jgi:hypothetical protein
MGLEAIHCPQINLLRAALPGNNTQGACHQEIGPQQGHSPDLLIVGLAAALSQYA